MLSIPTPSQSAWDPPRDRIDWLRLTIDRERGARGAYATYRRGNQASKSVRIVLANLMGDWTSLAVGEQNGMSRLDAVLEVRDDGPGNSKSARIALYLSSDTALDGGDVAVTLRKVAGPVAPGKSRRVKISFTRRGSLAGRYLVAVLDPQARLDDLDRPNDTIAGLLGN